MTTERSNLSRVDTAATGLEGEILKILGIAKGNDNEESRAPNTCAVCQDIAHFAAIEIGNLFLNAQESKCPGCSFLGLLLHEIFGGFQRIDMGSTVIVHPILGGGDFLLCISPRGLRPPIFAYSGLIEVYRKPVMSLSA